MVEQWRDIAGYEGLYQVSDLGRVKSLPFMQRAVSKRGKEYWRQTKERILHQGLQNSGYMLVFLWKGDKQKACTVHRLVAKAFLPTSTKRTVNHIDGNKRNNALVNLEWVSYTDNHLHAVELGLNLQAVRVQCPVTGAIFGSITQACKALHHSPRYVRRVFKRVPICST